MPPAIAIALPETATPTKAPHGVELDEMIGWAVTRAAAMLYVQIWEFNRGGVREATKTTSGERLATLYEIRALALGNGMSDEDFAWKSKWYGEMTFRRECNGTITDEWVAQLVDGTLEILRKTVTAMMN